MEPFALLKMMDLCDRRHHRTDRSVSAPACRRRDFRAAVGISAGLWLVCEILVDIGAVHEMSIGLFSAAAALGAMGLMFALGLLLCALVCRLLRRKQLA